jgi:hypothetical protein
MEVQSVMRAPHPSDGTILLAARDSGILRTM